MLFSLLWICLLAQIAKASPVIQPHDAAKHGQTPERIPFIDFVRDRLSVKIDAAPLTTVLKLLAERTGARVTLLGRSDHIVSADFTGQPLEEGIKRLLRGRNSALYYGSRAQGGKTVYRLSEICIFPLPDELPGQTTIFDGSEALSLLVRPHAVASDGQKEINPEIARLSKRLIQSKDGQARQQAAAELAKISDPNVIGPLSEALMRDAEPQVRATAAEALARTWDEAAVAPLSRALSEDKSANVREAAAKALGVTWSDHAIYPLTAALLGDRDAIVREQAARALAEVGGEEALDALLQALGGDPRIFVREAAATALGSIGGRDALAALAKASAIDSDPWVREAATIAAINSPK